MESPKGNLWALATDKGRILTDRVLISNELSNFHERSKKANTSIPLGMLLPVVWVHIFL